MSVDPLAPSESKGLIGRYKIKKRIGAGGMGAVYRAVHVDLGREVALKILPSDLASKADMRERFKQEARHAAKLRHENIVTLYEIDEANGTHFLAMEYVEGCNLHEYIDKKGKLEPEEARRILIQAAKALVVAHKQNIVHRDIKPSNFLLTEKEGKLLIKLTDFGLARTIDDTDFKVTKTGTTVGTVDYISPEQARNSRSADTRSDIYSLGCTLYHMLAGRPPFPEGDLTERLLKHLEAEPPDVLKANPQIPPGLVIVLSKMLAKKPADRYQTPADLLKNLETLPSAPLANPRAALEALATASGEKAKLARAAAETRKHTALDPTKPMGALGKPEASAKLRFRGGRGPRRAKRGGLGDITIQPWLVISGWKAWLIVLALGAAMTLIVMAFSNKWGVKPPPLDSDDPALAEDDDSGKPKKLAQLKEIKEGSKAILDQVKNDRAQQIPDGMNRAPDQLATQQLLNEQKIEAPPIYKPDANLMESLREKFQGPAVKNAKNNMDFIREAYQNDPLDASSARRPTTPPSPLDLQPRPTEPAPPIQPTGPGSEPAPVFPPSVKPPSVPDRKDSANMLDLPITPPQRGPNPSGIGSPPQSPAANTVPPASQNVASTPVNPPQQRGDPITTQPVTSVPAPPPVNDKANGAPNEPAITPSQARPEPLNGTPATQNPVLNETRPPVKNVVRTPSDKAQPGGDTGPRPPVTRDPSPTPVPGKNVRNPDDTPLVVPGRASEPQNSGPPPQDPRPATNTTPSPKKTENTYVPAVKQDPPVLERSQTGAPIEKQPLPSMVRQPRPDAGRPRSDLPSAKTESLSNPQPGPRPQETSPAPRVSPKNETPPAKPANPVFVVSRSHAARAANQFSSLNAAVTHALAHTKKTDMVVIEIHDNGPLFETPVDLTGRSLVLRAAPGFRPLIAWDVQAAKSAGLSQLLSVTHGNLGLANLDLVLQCSDAAVTEIESLLRVDGGDFLAQDCSFSVAGKPRALVSVVRMEGQRPDKETMKCWLNRCALRGSEVVSFDFHSAGVEAALEDCLVVGGRRPLVYLTGGMGAPATSFRFARSTLVASDTLFRVRPAPNADGTAAVEFLGWDSLLARYGADNGGVLLRLDDGTSPTGMQWQAINCLYAGWQSLLRSAGENIEQNDLERWHALWHQPAADRATAQTWPAQLPGDPAETARVVFRPAEAHVNYANSTRRSMLGCDLLKLPPFRESWVTATYGPLVSAEFDVVSLEHPPEALPATDGRYYGERLDLTRIDLGEHLKAIQEKTKLGARVIMHLAGKGPTKTSPIHIKGSSLVLYFEPAESAAQRLVLTPKDGVNGSEHEALIEIEDGGLQIIGGGVVLPGSAGEEAPPYIIKVRGGELGIFGSRLQGALGKASPRYRGLIHFEGSGEGDSIGLRDCQVVDSTLVSARACIHAVRAGSRVRLRNCVVAGGEAIRFDPPLQPHGRLNMMGILRNNTIATQHAAVRVSDIQSNSAPVEPIQILAQANTFIDLSTPTMRRSGVLDFDGQALARGLLVWRGEGNSFGKDGVFYRDGAIPEPGVGDEAGRAAWTELWGSLGERAPMYRSLASVRSFDLDRPQLERLAVSPSSEKRSTMPGANFEQLGLLKKK